MHICLLTRALPSHQFGGLETHTLALAQGLVSRGHKVTIISSAKAVTAEFRSLYSQIKVVELPKTLPGKYSLSFFRESVKLIDELDKQESFDIIHSQGFAAFGYMFFKVKPLVVTIHGTLTSETMLFPKKFSIPNLWKYRKRLGISPLYRQLLSRADTILVDSHFSEQLLLQENETLNKKLAVVYLGIDTNHFISSDKTKAKPHFGIASDFLILAFGRITHSKGYHILIEALRKINNIPYQVIIAGDGPYRSQLEKMVKQYHLDRVTFLGKVAESEVPGLYRAADVFVHPDLTAPAFGLVAAEALSCGTPVIASHTGALPEVVTPEVGITIPPGDPETLASAMLELYLNSKRRNQMGIAARQRAESLFTLERMAAETESAYRKTVASR
ncbi:MAG: glycosyltransferase family 4 protein [bacterium]